MRTWCIGSVCGLMVLIGTEAFAEPPGRRAATLHMTATAYCDRGKTKSGIQARSGVVAADPKRLPIGTRMRIVSPPAVRGVYAVMDTGSEIKGRDLDIFMMSCRRAKRFGKRVVEVKVLRMPTERTEGTEKESKRR
jgi:3D (Asp-Asp-Asp) domain-containing protein